MDGLAIAVQQGDRDRLYAQRLHLRTQRLQRLVNERLDDGPVSGDALKDRQAALGGQKLWTTRRHQRVRRRGLLPTDLQKVRKPCGRQQRHRLRLSSEQRPRRVRQHIGQL